MLKKKYIPIMIGDQVFSKQLKNKKRWYLNKNYSYRAFIIQILCLEFK